MRPTSAALASQIGQEKRATLAVPLYDAWTAPIGARVPCPVCGQIFTKKRKKHYFNSDKCRFHFHDRRRMDFRAILRKLDIIIEMLGVSLQGPQAPVEFKPIKVSPEDLEFLQIIKKMEREVALAFRSKTSLSIPEKQS